MPWRGAVLVTGGAGYVGSHVVLALARQGRRVVVLDDLSAGRREFAAWGVFVLGRVQDEDRVRRLCRDHNVTSVVHLAGLTSVEESMREPQRYFTENAGGTVALLSAVAKEGVRVFVYTSSAAVYGTPASSPVPETAEIAPTNPYGESKALGAVMVLSSGLGTATLRLFNAAGAAWESGLGEAHDPETHLIPRALAAADGGTPLAIHGTDWPTPDGTCVRDYVHVEDAAAAHVAVLERLENGLPGGAWNVGSGTGSSVLQVIAEVEAVTGKRVERVLGPRREGDVPSLVADVSRLAADTGHSPTKSSLRRIVSDAWAFHTSRNSRLRGALAP